MFTSCKNTRAPTNSTHIWYIDNSGIDNTGSHNCHHCHLCFLYYLDIDECEDNPCHDNATCTDSEGSFSCMCDTGYTGDGYNMCNGEIWRLYCYFVINQLCGHCSFAYNLHLDLIT